MLTWTYFILALTALLPLINPAGSALVWLGLVGERPPVVYLKLARQIAVATFAFLVVVEFVGSPLLRFFGISLPVVQVAGGLVIASTAWRLLFEKDAHAESRDKHKEIGTSAPADCADEDLSGNVFYPYTFPITAGPGSLVVMLTLTARASANTLAGRAAAHAGIAAAAVVLAGSVYLCSGYAPKLLRAVSPGTVHGVLRVVAFLLMCIGVQIAWNGTALLAGQLLTNS